MSLRKSTYRTLTFLCFLLLANIGFAQYDIPDVPKEQTSLYDYYGLLQEGQKQALERKLVKYSDSTSTQIVVAIIASTKGEDISFLGAKWGQKWGIGQAKEDNGILILLARDDRKIDINTGYGIESIISDRDAEQIINRIIIPQFKNDNYYAGLDQGTDAIFQALNGEFQGTRANTKSNGLPFNPVFIVILFFIIKIILSRTRRGGGNSGGLGGKRSAAGSLLDVIILSNMGRGSWGGGSGGGSSGGGGGFGGGFGGGGFGGGGASGGW